MKLTLKSPEVLIVGAGPTGLSLALALTQHDVPVRIIDHAPPRPASESRALGTQARTMEIFEQLGVLAPMLDQGRIIRSFALQADGRSLGQIGFDGFDAPYPYILMLPQAEVERLLLERLAALGVTVERALALSSMTQDDDAVHTTLRHADGREETATTQYLVAADGARSTVRKALGVDFAGVQMQGQYLVDCKIDWQRDHPDDQGHLSLQPRSMLVFGRVSAERWRVIVSLQQDDPRMRRETPSLALMQALVDEHPWVGARLSDLSWASAFYISNRMVRQMRHGRIFLAGDAAHIHSPVGGQGMNTGVQDAYNLAWKLALRLRGRASDSLLESYHVERHPVIEELLRSTKLAEHVLMLQNPSLARLRNAALSWLTRLAVVQWVGQRWLAEFTVNYRRSPLVAEHHIGWDGPLHGLTARRAFDRGPRPGERAPDASQVVAGMGPVQRLFTVWAGETRHHLLVFAGPNPSPAQLTALRQLAHEVGQQYGDVIKPYLVQITGDEDDGLVLRDPTGNLHRRYGAAAPALYLVRPDGYIGFRSQPVAAVPLTRYLAQLLNAAAPVPALA